MLPDAKFYDGKFDVLQSGVREPAWLSCFGRNCRVSCLGEQKGIVIPGRRFSEGLKTSLPPLRAAVAAFRRVKLSASCCTGPVGGRGVNLPGGHTYLPKQQG